MAMIYSRTVYIVLCLVLIYLGSGLMSVVLANLISPFVALYYSHRKFYTKEMRYNLPKERSTKNEVKSALADIWVTAKKSGTNTIGHYIGTQGSTFIAGVYLPLAVTAQWGLMTQILGVVYGMASNMGISFYPEYCKLRLRGEMDAFIKKTSLSIAVMICILLLGGVGVIYICPYLFTIIKSQTSMPSDSIMFAYLVYLVILTNAQLFALMMSSRNVIPSPVAILTTSVTQLLITIILLQFTEFGIWALLLGPAISGCSYTLWKWTELELKNMKISAFHFYSTGFKEMGYYTMTLLK